MDTDTERWQLSVAERLIVAFTGLYMVAWLVAALVTGNQEFLYYLAVMCVLIAVVIAIHFHRRLPVSALAGLSLWGLAHMAGGLLPIPQAWPSGGKLHVLYNLWLIRGWLKYDQLLHAYGFGLVTWICWNFVQRVLREAGGSPKPSVGLLTLCAAAGMGWGALNEVVEFFATLLLPSTNVGGYRNTGWDLVANTVGAIAAAILIRAFAKL